MTHDVVLGKLVENPLQQRDAIHIAVAPVIAYEVLTPGQEIGFVDGNTTHVGKVNRSLGIVDPFLKDAVQPGQRIWMFLFPNTVTSMRHEWEHPDFVPTESERWLQDFAGDLNISYQSLMDAADAYLKDGSIYCLSDDTPDRVYYEKEEFWYHYAQVTRTTILPEVREDTFFRCAC